MIYAASDTDVNSKARLNNTDYAGPFHTDVLDKVTFNGTLVLKFANIDGLNLQFGYNLKASENLTSHGVGAAISYEW